MGRWYVFTPNKLSSQSLLNGPCVEDGRCVFDIVMKGPGSFETASGQEIARAAWKLLNECVRDKDGQGGVVSGIGTALLQKRPIKLWISG